EAESGAEKCARTRYVAGIDVGVDTTSAERLECKGGCGYDRARRDAASLRRRQHLNSHLEYSVALLHEGDSSGRLILRQNQPLGRRDVFVPLPEQGFGLCDRR